MGIPDEIEALFTAERALRAAEARLLSTEAASVRLALAQAVEEAMALDDEEESALRVYRLADVCAQVEGPEMVAALMTMIDHPEPLARQQACEALLDVAYERFKPVATAIEEALHAEKVSAGMLELPYILAEIHDPDPLPLMTRFLQHPDAEVVAAALGALVALGDPSAIEAIQPLTSDGRNAPPDELDDGPVALAQLAADAVAELGGSPP